MPKTKDPGASGARHGYGPPSSDFTRGKTPDPGPSDPEPADLLVLIQKTMMFDPVKMAEAFSDALTSHGLPGLDVDRLVASRSQDLEALAAANQRAIAGMQELAKRQVEILQQTMTETSTAVKRLAKVGSPQEAVALRTELAKDAFEKALTNMRELAAMMANSATAATDLINVRVARSFDEIKGEAGRAFGRRTENS